MSNWYYFNKRERNGMIVLIIILLSMMAFYVSMPYIYEELHVNTELDSATIAVLKQFDSTRLAKKVAWKEKQRQDSINRTKKYSNTTYSNHPKKNSKTIAVQLKSFNPNKSSVEELQSLGIPFWMAQRIDKYRSKGGEFKVKSDLARIYDFPDSLYQELAPFIELPDSIASSRKKPSSKSNQDVLIDINLSNATELKKLRGVGSAFSRRIINYRKKLGGYQHINQLKEVYGISDSLFLRLEPHVFVSDSNEINKININSATIQELQNHPYITYRMAADWVAYREKNGEFNTSKELLTSGLLNEPLYAKIVAYIRVQ